MSLSDLLSLEAAGILAAAGALTGLTVKVWPVVRRLGRFLDDVQGEPARPGAPARPGWGERLSAIEARQGATVERLDNLETSQLKVITRLESVESTTERVRAQTENSHTTNLRDDLDHVTGLVTDLHHRHGTTRSKEH